MSPRMAASGEGGVVVALPPPSSSQADVTALTYTSTSAPLLNGDRVGGPVMATAAFAVTVLGPTRGNECLSSYSSVHIPLPPASPGPPPSPRSVQMCSASTSTSMGSAAAAPLLPPPASALPPAVVPLAVAVPQSLRRLHGGGIRVAVHASMYVILAPYLPYMGGVGVMSAYVDQQQLAFDFLIFLVERNRELALSPNSAVLPYRKSILNSSNATLLAGFVAAGLNPITTAAYMDATLGDAET
ncbi:hypothetical protein Vretimale_11638 [Volvox reticuliferus]|uniref:Uncharacterized protein n=1 Tax=Volvox reticuliferus TaxID=1737510 RepID=A0A8J4LRZ1_9CHLO|nr:hypothetical protein Vretimale_11635 [Volvox reticuliferus]GIM07534.1 hypothetical protein Vretimale_11638 [Volvox reticuliferus]